MAAEIYINPASYKGLSSMFADMPPITIVVAYDAHDDWYIERVEANTPEGKVWLNFLTEWIDDTEPARAIEQNHEAMQALENAIADWGADRSDYEYETWRDSLTRGLAPGMTRFMHK